MDFMWTPWRYQYIAEAIAGKQPECIFCDAAARTNDDVTLIVHRGASCFVILNLYPYTSGHVMIVPYAHVAELALCDAATLNEMMQLAQRIEKNSAQAVQARRHELRNESGPRRRRRRNRPSSSARFATLGGRCKFYDRDGRNSRASGIAGHYL